jgi:hypothetical protein
LRAQRSNPESLNGRTLDCFAALAMTRIGELLQRRADGVELVAEEDASRVGHNGHDGECDTGGDQAILDRGGAILIGKKRPEQSHRQLLFIRFNVCSRRYQIGKLIDQALGRIKMQARLTLPAVS